MTDSAQGEVDWSRLMDQFDGDLAVVCEIVEAYAVETRESAEQLSESLAKRDVSALRRQAHTLGGTLRTFGIAAEERVARELETLTASGSLEGATEFVDRLVAAANRILPELDRFVETGGASGVG